MFDSREEAAMRLDGTIIQGPRGPVYVTVMESASRILYREFGMSGGLLPQTRTCELDDTFSIKPFPLGYINRGETCYYLQRMPVRKYKQGLHDGALRVGVNGEAKRAIRNRTLFLYEGVSFYNMYFDIYPPLLEVKAMLRTGDYHSQAFGREWSLGIRDNTTHSLYYKGNEVGFYVKESGEFVLDEKRKYLQEALMEVVV